MAAMSEQGYTSEEIIEFTKEATQNINEAGNILPENVMDAMHAGDMKTILEYLGPRSTINNRIDGIDPRWSHNTLLHSAGCFKKLGTMSILLQLGANIEIVNDLGATAFTWTFATTWDETDKAWKLLYEWGATIDGSLTDVRNRILNNPLLKTEFGGRRCEIIDLNIRKDLIGQTCVVEKYIPKKARYKITTEHTKETFLVGPNNLKRRDRTPKDPGYYVTFEDGATKRHDFSSNEECQAFVVP